ncbi:hypothetical protein NDU88_007097 [Pleurodeles waltl]|uniref:Uncharacterized protein n=1 Tax=Pleurodeles waltl TaxID=8319 RepID=A0AAV7QJW2_PLEWA|nr:hypothetical protein NDU88_007097 [Pleurodeles waltl]
MATGRTASTRGGRTESLTASRGGRGVSSQAAGKKWMVPQGQSRTGRTAQQERPYRTRSHAAANTGMKQGNSNGGSRVGGSACDNQALVASVKMLIQGCQPPFCPNGYMGPGPVSDVRKPLYIGCAESLHAVEYFRLV